MIFRTDLMFWYQFRFHIQSLFFQSICG
jgi:hypothetical protein